MPRLLPLIILIAHFLPIQLHLPTMVAAEVVVAAAVAAVAIEEALVVIKKALVADDGNTTVIALQARRTHLHFN